MNWKNMQVSMPISTNYRSSCLQVTENGRNGKTGKRLWKIPSKATTVDSYFSTVTWLGIFVKWTSPRVFS